MSRIQRKFKQSTCRMGAMALLLALAAGCEVPVAEKKPRARTAASGAHHRQEGDAASAGRPSGKAGAQNVVLRVNGDVVQPDAMVKELTEELEQKAKELPPQGFLDYLEERSARWIGDKIGEMLLYQKASLRVTEDMNKGIDKFVDGEIRKIVTRDHDGIERRYEKYLAERGQSLEDVRERLRREVLIGQYLESELRPRIAEPTRKELRADFEKQRESFAKSPRHSMSLIEVRILDRLPEGVDQPTREQVTAARSAARAHIQNAQREIRGGSSFADAARKYSEDLRAPDGGVWGWIKPGSVRERYEPAVEALYRLKKGDVSDIIETPESMFLVRCDDVEPGLNPTFENVQSQLREQHMRASYNALIGEMIGSLRKKARIEPEDLATFHQAVLEATLRTMAAWNTRG